MTDADLLRHRLINQHVGGTAFTKAADVVKWLGAVQAQDYPGAKWALAQRAAGLTDASLDRAFASGSILRTHVMRPTWHFVAPSDLRWLLELTAPRVNAACASYYRNFNLDDVVVARSHDVLVMALRGGKALTRAELAGRLIGAGVLSPRDDKIRLAFMMMRAELDAVVCSGPKAGKKFTYALFDERVTRPRRLTRDEARSELISRYVQSHGPATVRDFVWWSGLTTADARAGIEAVRPALVSEQIDGKTYWRSQDGPRPGGRRPTAHLLPIYDECFVAYRDRAPMNFSQAIVIDSRVAGTWRRTIDKDTVVIDASPLSAFNKAARDAVAEAGDRYARFLGARVAVRFVR